MKRLKKIKLLLLCFSSVLCNAQSGTYCNYIKDIDRNYDSISLSINSKHLFSDSCSLYLLDSLKRKYVITSKQKYIFIINKIAIISDGYISESVVDIVEQLCTTKTEDFMSYLFACKSNTEKGLQKYFFEILSNCQTNSLFYQKIAEWVNKKKAKELYDKKGIERAKQEIAKKPK